MDDRDKTGERESGNIRMRQMERELARIGELVGSGRADISLVTSVALLQSSVKDLRDDIKNLKRDFDEREKFHADERRSLRVALIGLTATIIASLIAAAVTLYVSSHR